MFNEMREENPAYEISSLNEAISDSLTLVLGPWFFAVFFLSAGAAYKQKCELEVDDLRLYAYELLPESQEFAQKLGCFFENIDINEARSSLDIFFDKNLYDAMEKAEDLSADLLVAFNGCLKNALKSSSTYPLNDEAINNFACKLSIANRAFEAIHGKRFGMQFVEFNFANNIAILDFQILVAGKSLDYSKLQVFLEKSHKFDKIQIINLDYSLLALELLNTIESLFKFYAVKANSCEIIFTDVAQLPKEFVFLVMQIKMNVAQEQYYVHNQKLLSWPMICHNAVNSINVAKYRIFSEVCNFFIPYGSFDKSYNYKDIAHFIKNKGHGFLANPEFLDFFSSRILRVHDSVLFEVYVHAIMANNRYVRVLCEKALPGELKINLTVNLHGAVLVPVCDIDILDALLLQAYGAKLNTRQLSKEQVAILQDQDIKRLYYMPIASLIKYKQFLNKLNNHARPEITLKSLTMFAAVHKLANVFGKANLSTPIIINKILDCLGGQQEKTKNLVFSKNLSTQDSIKQLEFSPLLVEEKPAVKNMCRIS